MNGEDLMHEFDAHKFVEINKLELIFLVSRL